MSNNLKYIIKTNLSKEYDDSNFKLIGKLDEFNIKGPSFKLTDNTLFDHLIKLYSLWLNVLHEKKYILINKIGFGLNLFFELFYFLQNSFANCFSNFSFCYWQSFC